MGWATITSRKDTMMIRSRSALLTRIVTMALVGGIVSRPAAAQQQHSLGRWVIDSKASLAWWQVNPHMNHLWGTTCPEEPSWRPGEGLSSGWSVTQRPEMRAGDAATYDTVHIPLYPRFKVRPVCTEAIQGTVSLPDTLHWRGVQGSIVIKSADIISGEGMRDTHTRDAVLQISTYPTVSFQLDSIINPVRRGDTVFTTGLGKLSLHGATKDVKAQIRSFPEAGGIRVLSRVAIPARSLVDDYGISKRAFGLGVMMDIWKEVYMGTDLVLRPEGQQGSDAHGN